MAIKLGGGDKARSVSASGHVQISAEEFKMWLMSFDSDGDGRISKEELREAVRSRGVWFSGWKCGRGMKNADADGSGYIDEDEIDHLTEFAEKKLGFKFYG